MYKLPENVLDLHELRENTQVFVDRKHAGEVLRVMLQPFRDTGGLLLGIPAGGVPVASNIQETLALEMDVAVSAKSHCLGIRRPAMVQFILMARLGLIRTC